MTAVSDVFPAADGMAMPVGNPDSGVVSGRGARTRGRARTMVTERDSSRVVAAGAAVWADLRGAWIWRGQPPTLADLWQARIPPLGRVPGQSKTLRVAWAVANHAVLPVFAVTAFALWVLMHPARIGLALAVAVPIALIWING